jgi:hypothetical protein
MDCDNITSFCKNWRFGKGRKSYLEERDNFCTGEDFGELRGWDLVVGD